MNIGRRCPYWDNVSIQCIHSTVAVMSLLRPGVLTNNIQLWHWCFDSGHMPLNIIQLNLVFLFQVLWMPPNVHQELSVMPRVVQTYQTVTPVQVATTVICQASPYQGVNVMQAITAQTLPLSRIQCHPVMNVPQDSSVRLTLAIQRPVHQVCQGHLHTVYESLQVIVCLPV